MPDNENFIGIFCRLRIQCTLTENRKSLNGKDIRISQKGDYKPAYKKFQKTTGDQLQDIPAELAEIVAIWHDLPVHIKAAIKALIHTCNKEIE